MKRDGLKKKWLVLILSGLGAVIVGLIVAIVVVSVMSNKSNEDLVIFDESEGAVDCSKVEELEDTSQIANCLGRDYRNGKEGEVIARYNKLIDEAFENGNETRFQSLLSSLAFLYLDAGQCDNAAKVIGDERTNSLSAEEAYAFYGNASYLFAECGDDEKAAQYEDLGEQILESGEMEEAPNFDDINGVEVLEGEDYYAED